MCLSSTTSNTQASPANSQRIRTTFRPDSRENNPHSTMKDWLLKIENLKLSPRRLPKMRPGSRCRCSRNALECIYAPNGAQPRLFRRPSEENPC
ncbi:hypothetical protein M758_UG230400 [Ceratodon purpureus]|nr:hypothetical protein M758_UG230400 [Ceratodon purpureus]